MAWPPLAAQEAQTTLFFFLFYNLVTNILAKNNLTVKGREYLLNMYIIKDNIANAAVT